MSLPAASRDGSATGGADAVRILELKPRCSLSPQGAHIFLLVVGSTTFAVAGVFAVQGYWPVLPFAGLEVGGLIWAVRHSMRAGARRQTITISADSVTVQSSGHSAAHSAVFPRHWTRVTLHAPLAALHPSRLTVESHGRACEVGRFLTEDERRRLAVRLKQLVGNVNESPAL